jgi:hypothetical protein
MCVEYLLFDSENYTDFISNLNCLFVILGLRFIGGVWEIVWKENSFH